MKIFKQKTIYIFKETKQGYFTVLLSHPYFSYGSHSINRYQLPYFYIQKIDKTFRALFKDYKLVFRKPRMTTIERMQWTVFACVVMEFRIYLQLHINGRIKEYWDRAIDIYFEMLYRKAGLTPKLNLTETESNVYADLTTDQIYHSLIFMENTIQNDYNTIQTRAFSKN